MSEILTKDIYALKWTITIVVGDFLPTLFVVYSNVDFDSESVQCVAKTADSSTNV
jgi:hypothetical protein